MNWRFLQKHLAGSTGRGIQPVSGRYANNRIWEVDHAKNVESAGMGNAFL